MALTVSARSTLHWPEHAEPDQGAAICAALGIGSSITEYADFGKWLTVIGVLLLIVGPAPLRSAWARTPRSSSKLAAPRKKKKQKSSAASAEADASRTRTAEARAASGFAAQHGDRHVFARGPG